MLLIVKLNVSLTALLAESVQAIRMNKAHLKVLPVQLPVPLLMTTLKEPVIQL